MDHNRLLKVNLNRIGTLLLFFCLLSCSNDENEEVASIGSWNQLANFSGDARSGGISFSLLGKGYYGMGSNSEDPFLRDIWSFDPNTETWQQKNDFPYDVPAEVALALEDKAYVMTFSGSVYEYDPALDSWSYLTTFPPGSRPGITGFVIGSNLYFGTGNSSSHPITHFNDIWRLDPASKSWTKMSDFPGVPRTEAFSFVINGKAYLGLGYESSAPPFNKDFWEYDAVGDEWLQVADIPDFNSAPGILMVSNTKAYVGIADNTETQHRARVFEYDPIVNSWRIVKYFPSKNSIGTQSFYLNDRLFVVGGFWSDSSKDVWEFIP